MASVLFWDSSSSSVFHNSYGEDMRMFDKVLSATGFGAFDFTPVNVKQAIVPHVNHKRRKLNHGEAQITENERFKCDSCIQTFSVKKSRDRHQDSVHKQQEFPCPSCDSVFTRKDMRTRHQNEKHGGRRRLRPSISSTTRTAIAMDTVPNNPEDMFGTVEDAAFSRQSSSTPMEFESRSSTSIATIGHPEPSDVEDSISSDEPDELHDPDSPFRMVELDPIINSLLLCTDLLIRSKPYKRFFIHDKKRDLIARKKWRVPDIAFYQSYDSAIRTLRLELASNKTDPELLAAVAAFVNVDVLINGPKKMGYHAKAMYALKAHHRSRRDQIFDALEAAFEHCGKVCRTVRIIYTKHGFVWMLNMGYRCLKIPID